MSSHPATHTSMPWPPAVSFVAHTAAGSTLLAKSAIFLSPFVFLLAVSAVATSKAVRRSAAGLLAMISLILHGECGGG